MRYFILLYVLTLCAAHSWLHCVNYDKAAPLKVGSIDNKKCYGYPRGLNAATVFGLDYGFDYIPSGDVACKYQPNGKSVAMRRGETYRLLWPAKNHKADKCTNEWITYKQLKLYLYRGSTSDKDPALSTWTKQEYLIKDFKLNGAGFQNCPDFCTDSDKAPCYGDFQIPQNIADGSYKALWFWEFNPGQIFTFCFDITVGGASTTPAPSSKTTLTPTTRAPTSKTTLTPTTRAPTSKTTLTPTTRAPTSKATLMPTTRAPTSKATLMPNSKMCLSQFEQCGGIYYKGITECCGLLECNRVNEFYSQCVKPANAQCIEKFSQCDGQTYNGLKNCCAGKCVKVNEYFWNCD